MARDRTISVRVEEQVETALKEAAAADDRPVGSYVERLIRVHLIKEGYLGGAEAGSVATAKPPRPAAGRGRRR